MSQLQKLSYSRLVTRTNYYRDKALDLGKEIVSTKEELELLKKKLDKVRLEKKQLQDKLAKKDQSSAIETSEQLEKLRKENEQLQKQLENYESDLANEREPASDYEDKIAGYEELLSDIQTEMIQKEKEIDYYKTKVRNLEKRASYTPTTLAEIDAVQNETKREETMNKTAILSYFDYTVLWQNKAKIVIRGDFHITNIGRERLKNPILCFRFSPPEMSHMKGKITSIEQETLTQQTAGSQSGEWMFLESEWTKEAKERGEIWVVPTKEMMIPAGVTVSLNEFQIPVQMEGNGTFYVEGFVYFQESAFKAKAANHIMISR